IDEAGQLLAQLALDWAPDAPAEPEPKRLAAALGGRIPIVYGGPVTGAAARRWRSQINENAKLPAFYGELPEAHHNEVVGWHHAPDELLGVVLETAGDHERMGRRFDVTAEVMKAAGFAATHVDAIGESPTA